MLDESKIMQAVRQNLNRIEIVEPGPATDTDWTRAVKDKLCEIGQGSFGCKVAATGADNADYREWLYDVTWLKGELWNEPLVDVHLVAECEWRADFTEIEYDFNKLLLARSAVRLMIYTVSRRYGGSQGIAERLAARVKEFKGSLAEDIWLLAGWQRSENRKGWSFRYFTIDKGGLQALT